MQMPFFPTVIPVFSAGFLSVQPFLQPQSIFSTRLLISAQNAGENRVGNLPLHKFLLNALLQHVVESLQGGGFVPEHQLHPAHAAKIFHAGIFLFLRHLRAGQETLYCPESAMHRIHPQLFPPERRQAADLSLISRLNVHVHQPLISGVNITPVIALVDIGRLLILSHPGQALCQIVPKPDIFVLPRQFLILPVGFQSLLITAQKGIQISHIRVDHRGHLFIHVQNSLFQKDKGSLIIPQVLVHKAQPVKGIGIGRVDVKGLLKIFPGLLVAAGRSVENPPLHKHKVIGIMVQVFRQDGQPLLVGFHIPFFHRPQILSAELLQSAVKLACLHGRMVPLKGIGIQYRALHPVFRRIPQDRLQILLALQIQINLGQVFISLGKIWKISDTLSGGAHHASGVELLSVGLHGVGIGGKDLILVHQLLGDLQAFLILPHLRAEQRKLHKDIEIFHIPCEHAFPLLHRAGKVLLLLIAQTVKTLHADQMNLAQPVPILFLVAAALCKLLLQGSLPFPGHLYSVLIITLLHIELCHKSLELRVPILGQTLLD